MTVLPKGMGEFAWAISGRGAAAVLQAASLVLLARFSDPADFGLTMAVQGGLLTVAFLLGFGFGPYASITQAKSQFSEEVSRVVYLNQRTSLGAGAVCLAFLVIAGSIHPSIMFLIPFAFAMAAHRNSSVWEGIAVANGRIRLFSLTLLLRRLLLVLVFLGGAVSGVNPLLAYASAYAVSEMAINWNLKRSLGRIPQPSVRPSFRDVSRRSMPYWIESVSVQLRGLDVSFAGLAGGAVVSGLYAVPARLSSAILMVPSTFANLCLPRIARGTRRTFLSVGLASIPVMILVIVLLAILSVFAESIIRIVLGDEYVNATLPTQIFCIGFALLSIVTIANAMAQGIGLTRQVAVSSMVGAALVVIFVGIGALSFGAEGSSWGYSSAIFVQLIILCSVTFRPVFEYLRS